MADSNKATPQLVMKAPTRELFIQTYDEARNYSGGTDLIVANIYGVFQQLRALACKELIFEDFNF